MDPDRRQPDGFLGAMTRTVAAITHPRAGQALRVAGHLDEATERVGEPHVVDRPAVDLE